MDYRNVQSARREGMRDLPAETDIDYEREPLEDTDADLKSESSEEYLKKLGRQTEV
ncbi:MAG TPA: hypothetical protein PKA19_08225 [Bacillota bacterium]|nr:hypothetical protein [Bacillota bacterium]